MDSRGEVRKSGDTIHPRERTGGERLAQRGGASPAQWAELPDLDSRNYLILQDSLFYVFFAVNFKHIRR